MAGTAASVSLTTRSMLAVPTILRKFKMEIEPGQEEAENLPLLANHIKGGLPVRLRRRERTDAVRPAAVVDTTPPGIPLDTTQPETQ